MQYSLFLYSELNEFVNIKHKLNQKIKKFQLTSSKQTMHFEKKLITIFKTFIEKNLIPQIKKVDGLLTEWNKFSSMVSSEHINYSQLQFYVDSLPTIGNSNLSSQIPSSYEKNKLGGNNELTTDSLSPGFNPSKTFGGDRAKMVFANKVDYDDFNTQKKDTDFSSNTKEDPYKKNMTNSNQAIVPAMQRLYKQFLENQVKIQSISGGGNNGYISSTSDYKSYY